MTKFISETDKLHNLQGLETKYCVAYTGDKSLDLHEYIIDSIVFSSSVVEHTDEYDSISYTGECSMCRFGCDRHIIFKFTNGEFGYLIYWSGCLTFLEFGIFYTLELADSLEDVIQYCLTDSIRKLYYDKINRFTVLDSYFIIDLKHIILDYIPEYNRDMSECFHKNYPF